MKVNEKVWKEFVQWAEQNVNANEIDKYGFKETTNLFNEWQKNKNKKNNLTKDVPKNVMKKIYEQAKEANEEYKKYIEFENKPKKNNKDIDSNMLEPNENEMKYKYFDPREFEEYYSEEENSMIKFIETLIKAMGIEKVEFDKLYGAQFLDEIDEIDEIDENEMPEDQLSDEDQEELDKYLEFERELFENKKNKRPEKTSKYYKEYKFNPNQEVQSIVKTDMNKEKIKEIFKYAKKEFINEANKKKIQNQISKENKNLIYMMNGENVNIDENVAMAFRTQPDKNGNYKVANIIYKDNMNKTEQTIYNDIQVIMKKASIKANKETKMYQSKTDDLYSIMYMNSLIDNGVDELKKAGYEVLAVQQYNEKE